METFTLNNGVTIPQLGFGTWRIPEGQAVYDAVTCALHEGYRLIDTAYVYENERGVGRAINESGIAREEIFLVSKLPAEIKTYEGTIASFEESLSNLGADYLDLYLIHAPWPWDDMGGDYNEGNVQAWKAMEELYRQKKCRAIGVSNFDADNIRYLLERCEVAPAANQIRYFVGYTQPDITRFCQDENILVMGFSPLATGELLGNEDVQAIARKCGVSVAQLSLRYCLQKGVLPLPRSTNAGRIKENAQLGFTIGAEDMALLDALHGTARVPAGPGEE